MRVAALVLGLLGSFLLVVVAAIAFIAMPWILLALGTTFDDLPARPPLARLRVMRQDGQTTEIHATLARGCRLEDSVDVRLFDGFETALTREEAERRLGPPRGQWRVPRTRAGGSEGLFGSVGAGALAPYYDRPAGRVTLRPYQTPEQGMRTVPVAFLTSCPLESLVSGRAAPEADHGRPSREGRGVPERPPQ
jgi:hypothetical protein